MRTLSVFLAASFLFFSVMSCQKQERFEQEPADKKLCIWCIAIAAKAAVDIVIGLSEGQWYKNTAADGSIQEGCSGVGSCAINGMADDGQGNGISVSQDPAEDWTYFDHFLDGGVILKLMDDSFILTYDESANPDDFDVLFYANDIFVSREWRIDNPSVLAELESDNPLLLAEGTHAVQYDENNHPYLILQEVTD